MSTLVEIEAAADALPAGRVVLERRGKGIAALVSMEDQQALEAMEDAADLKAAGKVHKERDEIPLTR